MSLTPRGTPPRDAGIQAVLTPNQTLLLQEGVWKYRIKNKSNGTMWLASLLPTPQRISTLLFFQVEDVKG